MVYALENLHTYEVKRIELLSLSQMKMRRTFVLKVFTFYHDLNSNSGDGT